MDINLSQDIDVPQLWTDVFPSMEDNQATTYPVSLWKGQITLPKVPLIGVSSWTKIGKPIPYDVIVIEFDINRIFATESLRQPDLGVEELFVPRPYLVIGAVASGFLVLGLAISSIAIAGSGLALVATIGAAIWEIRRK